MPTLGQDVFQCEVSSGCGFYPRAAGTLRVQMLLRDMKRFCFVRRICLIRLLLYGATNLHATENHSEPGVSGNVCGDHLTFGPELENPVTLGAPPTQNLHNT
jgi:hypothetical protein